MAILGDMEYQTIVVDPPWSYNNKRTGGSFKSGSEQKYAVLNHNDICDIPIDSLAARDAHLFLWATSPLLPEAIDVMRFWGFTHKAVIVWEKTGRLGMGFNFRIQTEFCLYGRRGKAKALRCQSCNLIRAPARKHSQKPEEFWDLIDPVTPGPKLELFARDEARVGWDSWGDQCSEPIKLDQLDTWSEGVVTNSPV